MRKIFFLALPMMFLAGCSQKSPDAGICGVWANADCELVQTGKYSLFFERSGDKISVVLRQNITEGNTVYSEFVEGFVFDNAGRRYERVDPPQADRKIPLNDFAVRDGEKIVVAGTWSPMTLEQVERIDITDPYEMPEADPGNIGECLQAWQLGTLTYSMEPDNIHFEIGTNKGSYIFSCNPYTAYCRSARIKHNDNGSLFAQNIRLMANSREFTAHMEKDNLAVLRSEKEINDSLFNADACVFADEGIYWSFISCDPDAIRLNGCGEVYTFRRPEKGAEHVAEWFAYSGI